MNKNIWLTGLAGLALGLGVPATAAVVAGGNFDGENGGLTATNYTGFSDLTVSNGTVDIIRSGDFSIDCVGGTGSCVDLDGSTNDGGQLNTSVFAFGAGDLVTISAMVSGNQRGGAADNFTLGFDFGLDSYDLLDVKLTAGELGVFNVGDLPGVSSLFYFRANDLQAAVPFDEGFFYYSVSFRAASAGNVAGFVHDLGTDNQGVIVDDFMLDITPGAVPEPASWAMMIGGFALAGAAMRRRKVALRFA